MMKELSLKTGSIIVATGETDIITDGSNTYLITNGCEMLSMITGTGCMLTAIIATYISSHDILEGTILATILMGICGELSQHVKGTGSFKIELIDSIFNISDDIITERIKCKFI